MANLATTAGTESPTPALSVRHLAKSFGGVKALDGVSLDIWPGEIVGLVGVNGSGKSTFVKLLAGFHTPDEGEVLVAGESVAIPVPGTEARRLGLRFVHQELGLLPSLTVLENLLLDELSTSRRWRIPWRSERERARRLLRDFDLTIRPDDLVADVTPLQQAMLAILRAVKDAFPDQSPLSSAAAVVAGRGILILDEPTVFLTDTERERLFAVIRRLARAHVAIVFVSHDLSEVRGLCDRIIVFRDGCVVGNADLTEIADDDIVRLMAGADVLRFAKELRRRRADEADASVRVSGLRGRRLKSAEFVVGVGEIIGLTGLSGTGFEEVPYLLYGAVPGGSGSLIFGDETYDLRRFSPAAAIDAGVVLIPAERGRDAVIPELPLLDNVSLPLLDRFQVGTVFWLNTRGLRRASEAALRRFRVKYADATGPVSELSGGNQQRAVLAKWLQLEPRLLLLHEPTQGIDVAARQEIFRMLRAAAEDGMTVICATADYEQLALLCDRVVVFRNGRPSEELRGADVTEDRITTICHGQPAPPTCREREQDHV